MNLEFSEFMKIKTPVFQFKEYKSAFELFMYNHEYLHKMGISEIYGVRFVSF